MVERRLDKNIFRDDLFQVKNIGVDYTAKFSALDLTVDRVYAFPDASGTIALVGDSHSALSDLNWSDAGHVMNTTLDMDGNNIIGVGDYSSSSGHIELNSGGTADDTAIQLSSSLIGLFYDGTDIGLAYGGSQKIVYETDNDLTTLTFFTSTTSFGDGTMVSSSGSISFDNENLSTTGTLASGNATISGNLGLEANLIATATGNLTLNPDGGSVIFGGNSLVTVGNISGTDIDISAGTGDYLSTGNITIDSDASKIILGDGQDLELFHDGSNSVIISQNEDLLIQTADGTSGALPTMPDAIRITTGSGGNDTGGTAANGANGGLAFLTGGKGGDASGATILGNTGGGGGAFQSTGGVGGDADGGGTKAATGGIGGFASIVGGAGGDAVNGTTNTGGIGGNVNISPGSGGTGADANGADGIITIGDGGTVNYTQISAKGNLFFVGTAGFILGHMNIPSVDITVDTSGTTDPVEVKDDGTVSVDDGWVSVYQNGTTFAVSDLHYITVTIAGTYEVSWDYSIKTAAGGGTVIHGGIMVDGVAVRDNGESHTHIFNANDDIHISSVAIIDCPNGNEEISLWVTNDANQKTAIEHGNMEVKMIGGT